MHNVDHNNIRWIDDDYDWLRLQHYDHDHISAGVYWWVYLVFASQWIDHIYQQL